MDYDVRGMTGDATTRVRSRVLETRTPGSARGSGPGGPSLARPALVPPTSSHLHLLDRSVYLLACDSTALSRSRRAGGLPARSRGDSSCGYGGFTRPVLAVPSRAGALADHHRPAGVCCS